MLDIEGSENEVLPITKMQAKKAMYPKVTVEKARFEEAKQNIQNELRGETTAKPTKTPKGKGVPNIIRKVLETTIPVSIGELLDTLPLLQVALTQGMQPTEQDPQGNQKQ